MYDLKNKKQFDQNPDELSFGEQIKLFLKNLFGTLPDKAFDTDDLTYRWFIIGKQRLKKEMDAVRILRQLRVT